MKYDAEDADDQQSYFSAANNFSFSFNIILGDIFLIFLYSFSFTGNNNSSFYLVLG